MIDYAIFIVMVTRESGGDRIRSPSAPRVSKTAKP